jgi:hypothetical protein
MDGKQLPCEWLSERSAHRSLGLRDTPNPQAEQSGALACGAHYPAAGRADCA